MSEDSRPQRKRPKPWQFSLRWLLWLTTVFAVLFAVCRWANVSAFASLVVALVFAVSLVAGFALVVALAESLGDDGEP